MNCNKFYKITCIAANKLIFQQLTRTHFNFLTIYGLNYTLYIIYCAKFMIYINVKFNFVKLIIFKILNLQFANLDLEDGDYTGQRYVPPAFRNKSSNIVVKYTFI